MASNSQEICAPPTSGKTAGTDLSVLLLRNASSNDSFQIPDGFSAVAISADRNIDSNGPEAVESFTLYLTSDDSSEVRAQEFDLDGIAEQESITLTGVELANAELRLGLDLDNNDIIGAPDATQLFDRYSNGHNNGSNNTRYLISTDQGLVVSRDGLGTIWMPADLRLRNIAGRHENRWDGPVLFSSAMPTTTLFHWRKDKPFKAFPSLAVPCSTTREWRILRWEGVHEVFSGFELYLNDGNTTSLLSFDFTGQLDSTQTLSEDERFTREISSGFDLNGDGITGISLNTEVLHGRPLDTQSSYSMGRSRFAYQGNDGVVLTRNRLYSDNDAPGGTANGSTYDLSTQNNNYSDIWSGPAAVLLSDASGNALKDLDLRAARSTFETPTNSNQEIADGFEVVVSTANGFELLSFDLNGTQTSSESLSGTELNNAEIWSRIDLDGDGSIGAQINTSRLRSQQRSQPRVRSIPRWHTPVCLQHLTRDSSFHSLP